VEKPERVNPAMVLTGNAKDANLYSIYLVDERACLGALLGEPRYLSMAPDALRIDLDDALTSIQVKNYARAQCDKNAQLKSCAVLCVVCCFAGACRLEAAPPFEIRADGTRITQFKKSLTIFAGFSNVESIDTNSIEFKNAVARALQDAAKKHEKNSEAIYATDTMTPRLSCSPISDQDLTLILKKAGCYDNFLPYINPVKAEPFNFPFENSLSPDTTALLVIDLQVLFLFSYTRLIFSLYHSVILLMLEDIWQQWDMMLPHWPNR